MNGRQVGLNRPGPGAQKVFMLDGESQRGTIPDVPETLIERLRCVAEHRSADVFCYFLIDDTVHEITFGKLFAHAQLYAKLFGERGLTRDDVVFIVLRHRPDLLYAFVGALLTGCIPSILAPISEKQDPETFWLTLRHLFENVGAAAALIEPEDRTSIAVTVGLGTTKLIAPLDDDTAASECIEWPEAAPDDVAFLQFSSGTTGLRKGVMMTHRIVSKQIDAYADALAMNQHDRVASWLPLYHDMGLIASFVISKSVCLAAFK
jgi:acyl-CoA synthetase (AMP-forming)/AMP-acid ligase II